MGGMIVGFDADDKDIFQRQYDFAMGSPIPVFSLGALVAPAATPLHDRMRKANRLIDLGAAQTETAGAPWNTNIVPTHMSREELLDGVRNLCSTMYTTAVIIFLFHKFLQLRIKSGVGWGCGEKRGIKDLEI